MIFYKTVSSGNDFIHIDLQEFNKSGQTRENLARGLCARKTGIGADGLVFYQVHRKTVDFSIFNQDGSEAELSGNGMAGLAALLFYQKRFSQSLTLNTRAGKKSIELIDHTNNHFKLEVEIGTPDFNNLKQFPFLQPQQTDYQLGDVTFYPVSVGNPHTVVLLEKPISEEKLTEIALGLEKHSMFPSRTNVELVYNFQNNECCAHFHERGVGKTLSSSTGSAAIFAVLQNLGKIAEELVIHTTLQDFRIRGTSNIYVENLTKIMYKGVCLT